MTYGTVLFVSHRVTSSTERKRKTSTTLYGSSELSFEKSLFT
jgi:hypothetical protein